MTHTPGPWVVREYDYLIVTSDGDHYPIAERVAPADANLIAAAPDLLAALSAIVGAKGDWYDYDSFMDEDGLDIETESTVYYRDLKAAFDAIAKARGEGEGTPTP